MEFSLKLPFAQMLTSIDLDVLELDVITGKAKT